MSSSPMPNQGDAIVCQHVTNTQMLRMQVFVWVIQPLPVWLSGGGQAAQSTALVWMAVEHNQAYACAQATPLPFQGALQIGPLSLWGSSGGVMEAAVSALSLNSLAFLGLCFILNLKKEFSVWSKLVGEREHLYRKRCSWQTRAMFPSHYWRLECCN